MALHKILNSQSSLEKEEQSWRYHNPRFQDVLQSCSKQSSTVLAKNKQKKKTQKTKQIKKKTNKNKTKQKTHTDQQKTIDMPEINPCLYSQSMTKEARIYNGEKTVCLTNGSGENGQLTEKE